MQESDNFFARLSQSVRSMLGAEEPPPEYPTFSPTLPPTEKPAVQSLGIKSGAVVINGVELPEMVVMQLKMLGVPLANYNAGELKDAVIGCAVDCNLIDDDEGLSFTDQLTLTDFEQVDRGALKNAIGKVQVLAAETFGVADYGGNFTNRIKMERIRNFAQSLGGPEPVMSSM